MSETRLCPTCGTELSPGGVCATCLLELGLEDSKPEGPTLSDDASEAPTLAGPGGEAAGLETEQVGPYRLLRELGEGGMGTVYLAEQTEPIERRVALKVIKAGMDSAEVIARFESERQALALMAHPNIAKVLDAGTTEGGRPYFVMEWVDGVPITTYCDQQRLGARGRLELLLPVCRAVQHAHQKGIIHRDLKPSNVLVAVEDGEPQPKVIDFGIARATEQRLTEKTLFTQYGQIVGTPEYMSPEQAEAGAFDIDTTTDIYSLGVLLYELLTGVLPLDPRHLREAGYAEMQRIIREEEPAKPSTRVDHLGETATDVAQRRHTDPPSLVRRLRGDLDSIALKCLEKDRSRRYPSATELAADIERYLGNEPVLASPPSAVYRARKLIARHKLGFVFAASLFFLLVAFAVAMAIQSALIARERDRALEAETEARTEAETALRVTDFLVEIFDVSDPSEARGNTVTAREILDKATETIDRELEEQPVIRARLLETLGRVYGALSLIDQARALLESALEQHEDLFGDDSLEVAQTLHELAVLAEDIPPSAFPNGALYARRAIDIRRRLLGDDSLEVADSRLRLGEILTWTADTREEARALFEEVLAAREAMMPPDELAIAESLYLLGGLLSWGEEDFEGAEPLLLEALSIRRRLLGSDHPETIHTLQMLSNHYSRKGDLAKAEPFIVEALALEREVFGDEHFMVGATLNELGIVKAWSGQFEEAAEVFEESRRIVATSQGERWFFWVITWNLAENHAATGRLQEAESLYRQVIDFSRESGSRFLGEQLEDLALVLEITGRLDKAETALREARDARLELQDATDERLASIQLHLAQVLKKRGKRDEADALCDAVLLAQQDKLGDPDAVSTEVWMAVGSCLAELGRFDEAEPFLMRSLAGLRKHRNDAGLHVQRVLHQIVAVYEGLSQSEKAEEYRAMLTGPFRSGATTGHQKKTPQSHSGSAPLA